MLYNCDCIAGMGEIADGGVDAIICDPPFGTTDCHFDKRLPLDKMWSQFLRVCKPNAAIVLFSQMPFGAELIMSQPKLFRYEWIFEKSLGVGYLNSKKMPLRCHENILVFYRTLPTYNPQFTKGKRYSKTECPNVRVHNYGKTMVPGGSNDGEHYYPRDVLYYSSVAGIERRYHPQQKPLKLMEYLVRTYTNAGETVLDATMGSGTTGVAAINMGRRFIGFELDKENYEIACRRIERAQVSLFQ